MKFTNLKCLLVFLAHLAIITSCEKETDPVNQPVDLAADNQWYEDEILTDETLWYKVSGEATWNTIYIEWAEADYHGIDRSYSADIKVSAYMLDGITAYFEDNDNGYGDKNKAITLDAETGVLLKVEINDSARPGTFAIRATGAGVLNVTYTELALGDTWTAGTIADGEVKGYTVDCGDNEKVAIVWAESDSPEAGYNSEIRGSVFKWDGVTPYKDLTNNKDILNKNKSHSDDPKTILLDPSEKKIKIHLEVNTLPGTYAIKVYAISK